MNIPAWVRDWRTYLILAAVTSVSIVLALLTALVIGGVQERQAALALANAALSNEKQARDAANRQITFLVAQVQLLERNTRGNAAQIGFLREEIGFLQQQVRDLGGQPTIVEPAPPPPPEPRPSPSRTDASSRSPSRSPTPSPTCLPVICPR